MKRASPWLLLVSGILLLATAAAHGLLGWPAVRGELDAVHPPDDIVRAISIGWLYGSAAMAAFGVLALGAWRAARTGRMPVAGVAGTISALYVGFGGWALVRTSGGAHFIAFVALGLLLGLAAYGARETA
jgi:hypothetical protein